MKYNSENCVTIYTDGACKGNPGPAGIGVVLCYKGKTKEISTYLGPSTNNIAELSAIKIALSALTRKNINVVIYTDSQYCIGVLSLNWQAKKNTRIIQEIKEEMNTFDKVKFQYVPGHRNIKGNIRADYLANLSIRKHKTVSKKASTGCPAG